jgi:NAD(P)-dependent dehydrogenase (short-subunit alcohol dehydrogenase family)
MPLFDLTGRVAVVTGGYGVLGGSMAEALGAAGARVVVLGRDHRAAEAKAQALQAAGIGAMGLVADVLDDKALVRAREALLGEGGHPDQRGRRPRRRGPDGPRARFRDVASCVRRRRPPEPARHRVPDARVRRGDGAPAEGQRRERLVDGGDARAERRSRLLGGKGRGRELHALDGRRPRPALRRVNAIAPGFFVAKQNRAALVREDGSPTERGQKILARTPMGRFGDPLELRGPVLWLCSDAASFVTGAVIPVDGGFSADSGI